MNATTAKLRTERAHATIDERIVERTDILVEAGPVDCDPVPAAMRVRTSRHVHDDRCPGRSA